MNILKELEGLKRGHDYCEDSWYSCPQHPDGCANDGAGAECNCGANEHNARVDVIIAKLRTWGFNPLQDSE